MKISLIGVGEVGSCYAEAFARAGHTLHTFCDLRQDEAMQELARRYNATLVASPGPWLADSDVVVTAVFGHAAHAVAAQALPHMHSGATYIDVTTAGAPDMRAAAEVAAKYGIPFTDVAIMGAIILLGDKTPLLCAGTGAEAAAEFLRGIGAPARAIQGQAGDAVTLKLLRSIMTKGMESLAVECLVAAERKGLRSALYEVLSDIDHTPLTAFMDSFLRSHVLHATRRLAEVREARQQLEDEGLQPLVLDGVESLFARTAAGLQAERDANGGAPVNLPDNIEARLSWLTRLAEKHQDK